MWSIQPGPAFITRNTSAFDPNLAYTNKLLLLAPIAYWPMAEASGSVALDASGNGRNGAYTAVTLAQTGIGDGRTSASFDGATSYNNVYGASFAGAFNPAEGTLALWCKVSGAGVWTDAATRRIASLRADASNLVNLQKDTSNNSITTSYVAGGTTKSVSVAASATTFFHFACTWSKSADQFKAYVNGAQVGATQTGLGVWTGALSSTLTNIGATSQPGNVWSGALAHAVVFARACSAAEVLNMATVP